MEYRKNFGVDAFEFWGGAKDTYNIIIKNKKLDEFVEMGKTSGNNYNMPTDLDIIKENVLEVIETKDFKTFERVSTASELGNRNGALFPEKINGLYCRFDHITNYEVDDGFNLRLTFESGKRATVEVGTYNFIPMPRFYMTGTNGSAIINNWTENCRVVCCKNWDEKDVVPVRTAAGLTKTMAPRKDDTIKTHEIPQITSDVHDFYRNVAKAVDGVESQLITHPQLMRVMKLMEACAKSDETGMPVDFE